MDKINLTENFNRIFETLQDNNMNITAIAKSMGYTTSAQLHSALKGESMLSTKAIISLIENAHVNPTYLFLGQGEMFLTDESELDNLKKNYSELERKFFANQDDLLKCKEELERAVYRYNKLIDITSVAMENVKKREDKDENNHSE